MTTMTKTPPKLREPGTYPGHAKLTSTKRAWPGPESVHLYGTEAAPQLRVHDPNQFFGSGVYLNTTRDDLVRFAREVLAFLGEDYGVQLPPWRPASDGAGTRPWFLTRYDDEDPAAAAIPAEDRYRYSAAGVLVRYASEDAAQRAARRLNKAAAA